MKTIYIDTENHRIFKSIDELKQDVRFLAEFLEDWLDCTDKKLSEILTDKNIGDFFDRTFSNWEILRTNKNTIYINWGMDIFTDDLTFFIDQLDPDEVITETIRNYDNFLDLFNEIKNTNENGYEFIARKYIKYAEDYDIVNLEE